MEVLQRVIMLPVWKPFEAQGRKKVNSSGGSLLDMLKHHKDFVEGLFTVLDLDEDAAQEVQNLHADDCDLWDDPPDQAVCYHSKTGSGSISTT